MTILHDVAALYAITLPCFAVVEYTDCGHMVKRQTQFTPERGHGRCPVCDGSRRTKNKAWGPFTRRALDRLRGQARVVCPSCGADVGNRSHAGRCPLRVDEYKLREQWKQIDDGQLPF